MVERLVDRAEIIDPHDEKAAATARLTRLTQCRPQILDELVAVEEPRDCVRRAAPRELADRPDEEIRRSILGSTDLPLQTQPRKVALCILHTEVKLTIPSLGQSAERGEELRQRLSILHIDERGQHPRDILHRLCGEVVRQNK